MTALTLLGPSKGWKRGLKNLRGLFSWPAAIKLANAPLNFLKTNQLDETISRAAKDTLPGKIVRLAILSSSATRHLHAAIRVACVRRDILVTVYQAEYGQYLQEMVNRSSGLHDFEPHVVLFALDGHSLAAGVDPSMSKDAVDAELQRVLTHLEDCWRLTRRSFGCQILQQTPLPVHHDICGSNEHRVPGSKRVFIERLNVGLRSAVDAAGVDLLCVTRQVELEGLGAWHVEGLWHRLKQEVSPCAAPMYGELVARIVGAALGRSRKCLVLDLDGILWGGVIGDGSLDDIELGQGSTHGAAFVAFQSFCKQLAQLAEPQTDGDEARTLRPLQAAAITYRIAFGPRAGHKVLTLWGAMAREGMARELLCCDIDGFSLHAAVRVEAHDRKRLEQLCRYITRPALSDERVQLNAAAQVELKLKTPWRDGTTHLVMSPLEFLQRLAALVPRPRLHLIRFHGVLAPNAKLRSRVVPQGPPKDEEAPGVAASGVQCEAQTAQVGPGRISWARLLKRVFDIDMQRCPHCGAGELKIIAAILERPVIEKILSHLGLDPQPPPKGRVREAGLHFAA